MAIQTYKTVGGVADALYKKGEEIKVLKRSIEEKLGMLKTEYDMLEEQAFALLRKQRALRGGGAVGNLEIKESNIPAMEDWNEFYKHLKKTGEFDLLGRTLKAVAVKERWSVGKVVPGVGVFKKTKLSVTKKK